MFDQRIDETLHSGKAVFDDNSEKSPSEDFSDKLQKRASQRKPSASDDLRKEFTKCSEDGKLYRC